MKLKNYKLPNWIVDPLPAHQTMCHQHKETFHQIHQIFILQTLIQWAATMIALNLTREKNNTNIKNIQSLFTTHFKKTFSPKWCWKENKDAQKFMPKLLVVSKWMKVVSLKDKIFLTFDFSLQKSKVIFYFSFYLILFSLYCVFNFSMFSLYFFY